MNPSIMNNSVEQDARVIGVRGATWRARVDHLGTVHPEVGSTSGKTTSWEWHVAGDDRWYSPAHEPTVRQKWYSGFPVVETRMRVGGGDIIQRVWCVADAGGITVMEFENDTPATVAIAMTRSDLLTTREIADNPPQGIDLPAGSVVMPLAHRSTLRVGLGHVSPARGRLPDDVPDHQQVVRGWETACDIASRLTLPDHTVVATICRVRSDLLLSPGDAPVDAAPELVRMGETHHDSILEVVDAVQARLKREKRSKVLAWDTPHVLAVGARACVLLDDDRAAGDIGAAWLKMADRPVQEPPVEMPVGLAAIAWAESILARPSASGGLCELMPWGIPQTWWGANFEAHHLVGDPHRLVSYAVRWHGERPAVLWETTGAQGLVLTGGQADPQWSSVETSGEVLWRSPRPAEQ